MDCHEANAGIEQLEIDVLIDALNLPECGLDSPVGEHQAIKVEVAAGGNVRRPIVAAIGPVGDTIIVVLEQSLVHPVPDKAARQDVVTLDDVPVLGEIARAVSHRVSVLDEHEWTVVMCLRVLFELPITPVHARVKVGVTLADFLDIALRLVLDGARGIPGLEPLVCRAQINAVACFVTERPSHHRRKVLGALEHALRSIEVVGHPVRLVAERLVMIIAVAMTFDVGFVDDVEAVFARQFVPTFWLRVVRVAHGVHVRSLHQADIREHRLFIDDMTVHVVVLMKIDALELDKPTVDLEAAVADCDVTKTDRLGNDFTAFEFDKQHVQVGCLRGPCFDVGQIAPTPV